MTAQRHDWPQIIAEIRAWFFVVEGHELSDYKLGLLSGSDVRAIGRLAEDKHAQPRHYEGERLLQLHRQYRDLQNATQSAPRNHCAMEINRLT